MIEENGPFINRWGQVTDSEWLTALLKACHDPMIDGVLFPTLPSTETQRVIQGNSEEVAVRGSFQLYRFVRDALAKYNLPLRHDGRLLDFGTGWGRILRPFMRDLATKNIYAVEPSTEWALTARRCNPYVSVLQSEFQPPLPFREGFFRWIVAYSIFTHLPEAMFDQWMAEFLRIVEPDGIVAFTFLGDRIINELSRYSRPLDPNANIHFWHRILIDALGSYDPQGQRYADDEFIFLPTGQSPLYGDCFMSPELVRTKLQQNWEILEVDSSTLAQDICLIRKRAD